MQKLTMRKYKKEEEQYFTEYDPNKFYGVLILRPAGGYKRCLLSMTEHNSSLFNIKTLQPNSNGYGDKCLFENVCNSDEWQAFEFDTRKELLEWLLEEHK